MVARSGPGSDRLEDLERVVARFIVLGLDATVAALMLGVRIASRQAAGHCEDHERSRCRLQLMLS